MNNYIRIIKCICEYNEVAMDEFIDILKEKENKYLLILTLKKYKCFDKKKVKQLLNLHSDRSINYNMKKAEEKFLVNREFREKYFELEKSIEKII